MTSNKQKNIAAINDLAGYGKCALTISIPVISSMGIACCPVPTSIFSNHTGYPAVFCKDLTADMTDYIRQWEQLHFRFDGILCGYLASEKQIDIVAKFIKTFKTQSTIAVIDPVMGDHGKLYSAYTPSMCKKMKELIQHADILTPNLTEACILTDTPYQETWETSELMTLIQKLASMGPEKIVITGIEQQKNILNLCFEKKKQPVFISSPRIGTGRHGTGDIFSSIVAASAVKQTEFTDSVQKAADFIQKCLKHTMEADITEPEGILFEDLLYLLK